MSDSPRFDIQMRQFSHTNFFPHNNIYTAGEKLTQVKLWELIYHTTLFDVCTQYPTHIFYYYLI